jgi:LPXTG-motif cell wall-anchored protein
MKPAMDLPGRSPVDRVRAMDPSFSDALADPSTGSNAMVFLLVAGLGLAMALIYVPLRLFLTVTARSRRLRLLQRIRQLREQLAQPVRS